MRTYSYRSAFLVAFFLLCLSVWIPPASAQSWTNGYGHRRTITISHAKVPNTDQANFPVLISGTYSYLATTANSGQVTNANGYDIIFTSDAGGVMPLPYERETYVASSGAVSFWVQVPTVSHTTDTTIYMFYGNSSVTTDQSNKSGVWESSYQGVWHLPNGTSLSANDSTSNGNNGTVSGASPTSGVIDGAAKFAATSGQKIDVGDSSSLQITGSAITLEAWVNTSESNPSYWERILTKEVTNNANPYFGFALIRCAGSNHVQMGIATASGNLGVCSVSSLAMGNWEHIVGTYDGSNLRIYVNGALDNSVAESGNIIGTSQDVVIGTDTFLSGETFNGSIDEVRISNAVRSADWIAAEYNNQSSPSTFYSVGPGDWSNGYSYQVPITISHAKVPNTDQANFPVLISGTYSYLATTANGGQVTNANGYDIIFTSDAGGTIPLPYERETYVSSSGVVDFWVQVPTVSHTTDTVIYMFYGNSSVTTDRSNPPAVWDSNFKGVWHLDQTPNGSGSILDSTSNGFNGTPASSGISSSSSGIAGGSLNFNGASSANYVTFSTSTPGGPPITASIWIKTTGLNSTAQSQIMGKFVWSSSGWGIYDDGQYDANVFLRPYPNYNNIVDIPRSHINNGVWHYLTATIDSSNTLRFYLDGSLYGSTTTSSITTDTVDPLVIGGFGGNAGGGLLTEARVSNTVRSADWITTEYNNQSSPSAFYSIGASTAAPTLTSLSPASGSNGTVVTITGTNFGSSQGSSTITFNGVAAAPTSWNNTQIVVSVPSAAVSGSVLVTVSGVPSNPLTFTDSSIVIVQLLPTSGPVSTSVAIAGANFGITEGSSLVTFNGIAATPTSWSNSEIVVPVPSGATSGNVVVTVASGSSNGVPFSVTVPTISALSPSSGPTGTFVTISGSSFGLTQSQGSSTVTFSGTAATITSWSSTSIVASVPPAATSGNVVVTVAGVSSNGANFSVVPNISSLAPLSGLAGTSITIAGTGFGVTQGSSTVTFNGTTAVATNWSDSSITAVAPSGATTGNVIVTVGGYASNGVCFTVLPTGWLDQDIGNVGTAGSAVYANGAFTITGGGGGVWGTSDALNYMYQALDGDGSIVARVKSAPGAGNYTDAGVMIRETLNSNATAAFSGYFFGTQAIFIVRSTTGGGTGATDGATVSLPEWIKVVRSGSTFSGYESPDGVNWTAANGSPGTISMAQNVYVGLGVAQGSISNPITATLDYVSLNTAAAPASSITNVSANTASPGSQIVITGIGFGPSQGASMVMLNGSSVTINSWSSTSITFTVPANATSGPLAVLVAPSMNASNPVTVTITSQPLPSGWLDQDIGAVGTSGGATYSNGVFTVSAGGTGVYGSTDAFNFAYQSMNTDGKIVARVTSISGDGSQTQAGVMFRETLNANATTAFTADYNWSGQQMSFFTRSSTGANIASNDSSVISLPYWVMVERSGNTFTGFESPDGVNWTQTGSTTTVSMAQNAYIGLGVAQGGASSPVTATFDNVTVTSEAIPYISSVSPNSGLVGASVTVNGSDFGSSQGTSTISFGGVTAGSVTSWSNTQIVVTVTSNLYTGPIVVTVNGVQSNSNVTFTCLTSVISGLLPPAGPVGGSILIQGHSFGASQGSSTVQFNGSNATVASWSDTSITASVPTGATSGPVTVTVGGVTSNGVQFSVIEAATVTGISPNTGPLGTTVTITGTGFGATQSDSTVYFLGVPATVINSWSDTQIVAVVPPYTGTGPISVTVAGITVFGPTFTLSRLTELTDSLGNVSNYSASVLGGEWKPTGETGTGCSTCSSRGVINTTYDGNGNVLTRTDPAGNTTTYTYDTSNDLLSESAQLDSTHTATTSYTYNSFGEVLTMTDPLGNVTTNTYDSHGNLLTVTAPAPNSNTAASVTQFAYNSLGELTTITDPLGHGTTMTYTSAGLIATITDAQGNVTTYGYDAKGNRTSVTDALSHTTSYTFDAMNRLTQITY